mgnify:CR=1 FL=1
MKLSREKIDIAMAREKLTVAELAKRYGVSRSRMNFILNCREVTTVCAGRMADSLKIDVTEILED